MHINKFRGKMDSTDAIDYFSIILIIMWITDMINNRILLLFRQ